MAYTYTTILRDHPLPENRKERYLAVCQARFARLPVLKSLGFEVGFHEGYKEHKFGLRVGPNICIQGVVHDLAHVVEFGDKQFRKRTCGYGRMRFRVPKVWVIDRYCEEPETGQASMREARTFGIQFRLNELLGIPQNWDERCRSMLSTLRHMPDWFYFCESKQKRKLLKAMYRAYVTTSDADIDSRLQAWFASARRSRQRLIREQKAKAA